MTHANGNGPRLAGPGPAMMAGVGRHMAPLNGHLIPPAPDPPARHWWQDTDLLILILAAAAVLAVATFAAVVSYSHFYELARAHHQGGAAARLSPLSADGLIAAASLVMLNAARHKMPVPRLARAMLAAGILVTVAANVIAGLPPAWFGPVWSAWIGAAISAWPAVAFIGSVEMAVMFVRDARRAVNDPEQTRTVRTSPDSGQDKTPARTRTPRTGTRTGTDMDKARAAILDGQDTGKTIPQFAAEIGVTPKTVQRARADIRKGQNGG